MEELIIFILVVVLLILLLIARYRVVKKVNGKGWPGLIPIYGYGLICKKSNISIFLLILYYAIFAYGILLFIVLFMDSFIEFASVFFFIFFSLAGGVESEGFKNMIFFSDKVVNKAEKEIVYFLIATYLIRAYFAYKHAISFGRTKTSAIMYAIFNPFEMFFLGFSSAKYRIVKKKTR